MYLLYSALLSVAFVLAAPWWLKQRRRTGIGERLGRVPQRIRAAAARPTIWIHAVSVGEVLAVSRLVGELRARFPEKRVIVSTTTATGQKLARDKFGEQDVFYFPLDFAFAVRAYLRELRPELIVLAETEFWPRLLHEAWQSGARVAVVNARISDRSFPRYQRWCSFVARILKHVDIFLTQTDEDARRLKAIGANSARVSVSGNLKFDIVIREAPFTAQLRVMLLRARSPKVVVAGSTVEGEEEIVVRAFQQALNAGTPALLIIATRHPERFDTVAQLLTSTGIPWWRRSLLRGDEELRSGVLLLDSLGELGSIYALADIAFVGGSMVPRGGHNILEPATYGKAIVVGPYTENFRDIVEMFRSDEAVFVAGDEQTLASLFRRLLNDGSERAAYGARAAALVKRNEGATGRTLAALANLLPPTPARVTEDVAR
jgi:3-deoxy-D-manno-octulosonic-acid transferase